MALASELFPQPDSPKTTTARFESRVKSTPSTAWTGPWRVLKYKTSSSMRRSLLFCVIELYIPQPRIEDTIQCESKHRKAQPRSH